MVAVKQSLTPEQADTSIRAHDLYFRILSGQLGDIATLAREGLLRPATGRAPLDAADVARLAGLMAEARGILGFAPGESHGVGRAIHPSANAAYEIELATRKALADHRVPEGPGRAADNRHDGITVRYCQGPEPRAWIEDS